MDYNDIDWEDEEQCLEMVNVNPSTLEAVKCQTEKICLTAVRSNGWSLRYVENQTEDICIEAVKSNGNSIQFVKNQTLLICKIAWMYLIKLLMYVGDIQYKKEEQMETKLLLEQKLKEMI